MIDYVMLRYFDKVGTSYCSRMTGSEETAVSYHHKGEVINIAYSTSSEQPEDDYPYVPNVIQGKAKVINISNDIVEEFFKYLYIEVELIE